MDRMVRVLVSAAWLLLAAAPAWAQGTATSALSGVVTDGSGGAVPGATVVVKNNATSVTFQTVTNSTGQFSFPALAAATYTVTVSLSGFKTLSRATCVCSRAGRVRSMPSSRSVT
jgi:siroheme synthase